uniref:NADH dehydrogenase subunit 6 n=1 Tax=Hebesoma violentum TaxID=1410563 RepID=A0A0C4JX23_9BILA|nr:NADH dehydrogenase subunit 6 [Hebesoma violentum]
MVLDLESGEFGVMSKVLVVLACSLCWWGGGLRALAVMFCSVIWIVVSTLNMLSMEGVLLLTMIYISGVGVVFTYLASVDMWTAWGLSTVGLLVVGLGACIVELGGSVDVASLGCWTESGFSIESSLVLGCWVVCLAFLLTSWVFSEGGASVRMS